MNYEDFLKTKLLRDVPTGIAHPVTLGAELYPFQEGIVRWALRRGRAAIFADCGMGKTLMQLEWAAQVHKHTGGNVLILAPLAVAEQTVEEGARFGIEVTHARTEKDIKPGLNITNYERLDHFAGEQWSGVVLDESSILKSYTGKVRTQIIEAFQHVPFRLACTATPAPNDHMELGNHAEFLSVMSRTEMLAMFFCHDGGETQKWRLKGHAEDKFWQWMGSWAVAIRKPSDLGYDDGGFALPSLTIHEQIVEGDYSKEGFLFPVGAKDLNERRNARKASIYQRAVKAHELIKAEPDQQWLVWCDLNAEADVFKAMVGDAVEVRGCDPPEWKEKCLLGFSHGQYRRLISKPSIAGFGMNFQICSRMIFLGLSDSYESFYQAIRRCWRFGQENPVEVHLIISESEYEVLQNVKRKEEDAKIMSEGMVEHMADITSQELHGSTQTRMDYAEDTVTGDDWTLHLGDCVESIRKHIPDNSIHFSVFSPPFASLYTYSNSERDMGNCADYESFMAHFRFLVAELHRVLIPGRLVSFHCMNMPTSKARDGVIGLKDFRGDLIRTFDDAGFVYHSEVCIWKDPVTAMQRTKALGLLHKQLKKDSCMSRQGIPDYLVTMRKPGDNPERVTHTNESFPVSQWQEYASPVWMDINPSKTLQKASAREEKDERHICPLQLEVIERALELWTNPGDLVLSPFAGIGSEGYVSLLKGRRFVGCELKGSYFQQAVRNLRAAEQEAKHAQNDLFSMVGVA